MQGFVKESILGDFSHLKKNYDEKEAADAAFRRQRGCKGGIGLGERMQHVCCILHEKYTFQKFLCCISTCGTSLCKKRWRYNRCKAYANVPSMPVCMHVCMPACMPVCTHARMHVCLPACMHA